MNLSISTVSPAGMSACRAVSRKSKPVQKQPGSPLSTTSRHWLDLSASSRAAPISRIKAALILFCRCERAMLRIIVRAWVSTVRFSKRLVESIDIGSMTLRVSSIHRYGDSP